MKFNNAWYKTFLTGIERDYKKTDLFFSVANSLSINIWEFLENYDHWELFDAEVTMEDAIDSIYASIQESDEEINEIIEHLRSYELQDWGEIDGDIEILVTGLNLMKSLRKEMNRE